MSFLIGLVLAALPLLWLARRSPRAILPGGIAVALLAVVNFGLLGIAGAGVNPSADVPGMLVLLAVVIAALGGALLLTMRWASGSMDGAIALTARGAFAWLFVVAIGAWAFSQRPDPQAERDNAEWMRKHEAWQAERARTAHALATRPETRAVVLDSVLRRVEREYGREGGRPVARTVRFGDPVTAPDRIVVWLVLQPSSGGSWENVGAQVNNVFWSLNQWLGEAGWTWRVAVGGVLASDVEAAGGDAAYFGADGSRMTPQYGHADEPTQGFRFPPPPAPRQADLAADRS